MIPRFDVSYGSQPWQKVDLFLPEGAASAVVVYLHGGGFRKGDRKDAVVATLWPRLTASGVALASVGYRIGAGMDDLPEGRRPTVRAMMRASRQSGLVLSRTLYGPAFVAACWDISDAIHALRKGSVDISLKGVRIVALGMSAGGIAALSLAHPPRVWAKALARPDAVFAVAATMVQPWCLSRAGPPCRLLHGTVDRIVPLQDVRMAQEIAVGRGADLELLQTGIAGHNTQLAALSDGKDATGRPWFDALVAML